MRSIAQETAPQIALRNCSKEVVCMGGIKKQKIKKTYNSSE